MSDFAAGRRFWDALVAPSVELGGMVDRDRARLLSALLIAVFSLVSLSGVLRLLAADDFLPTFVAMATALTGLALAYGLSRAGHYRGAAALAACVIIVACAAVRVANPDDRVWYAFMMIGVVLGSTFLRLGAAIVIAAFAAISVGVVGAYAQPAQGPGTWLPPLMFHAVFSPLLLVLTRQRLASEEKRRRAERELEREQFENRHLEAIGRMASGVAHDFTNLLTVVLGNSRMLLEWRRFDETSVTDIRDAAERGVQFVEQLMLFARRQTSEPEVVDLNQVLVDLQPMLNRVVGGGIKLQIDRAPTLPSVKADPVQLERVLLNLAVNARQAMPAGGTLRIATAAQAPGSDGAPANGDGFVVLRVGDTGVGMDAATRASIFEPFFSTRVSEGGTGLGLAIVHGFVVQSGGHIDVESEPGRGTTFEIRLPSTSAA